MEQYISSNNITIWTETFGNKNNPPLLLIMGGGCQGIMWPKSFCEELAQHFGRINFAHFIPPCCGYGVNSRQIRGMGIVARLPGVNPGFVTGISTKTSAPPTWLMR